MPVVIQTKLATTTPVIDAVPAQLAAGELAVNPESKRLWVGTSNNQVAELITGGRPDAGTIQGQTLMWNATANNWEVNSVVRTTSVGQISFRNTASDTDYDFRIGSAGSNSNNFTIQPSSDNATGQILFYSGLLADGTTLQRQLLLSNTQVAIFPSLGNANTETAKVAYVNGNLQVGKPDATADAEGGEIRLLGADGAWSAVLDTRGTTAGPEARMYVPRQTTANLRIMNVNSASTGGISLETGAATTTGINITSNLVTVNSRTVHDSNALLNFSLPAEKRGYIAFSVPDQNNPARPGSLRGEIYYQDQTPTVNHRIQYNSVNKHMFGVTPLNNDNSFGNKADKMEINSFGVKVFGNLRVGPQDTTQEGGQVEYNAPDGSIGYITDLVTGANGNPATEAFFRIRPVGTHTSGGILIGGEGGGNSQPSIFMYTDGDVRFKIDSGGIVKGLWNDNGTSNSNAQFRVVSTMPATPDANIIYFVV